MKPEIKQRIEQINNGQVPEGYKKTELGIFPYDWKTKNFKQACDIFSGGTPDTSVSEYWNGDIPWCTPTDISKAPKYIFDTEKKITTLGLQESSATLMPKNSIIMCSRATIGPRSINTIPMATNQGFKNLICKEGYSTEFIYHYIEIMLDKMIAKSSGSTFLELSKSTLERMICPFPTFKEQEKIAEILMKWDKAIELQDNYIEKLKLKKKAIIDNIFNDNNKGNHFFCDLYLYASEGGTPSTSKTEYYDKGTIPFVKIEHLQNKYITSIDSYITDVGLKNSGAWLIPSNNLIFSNGASIGEVSINKIPVTTKQGILGIIPSKNISLEYFYYLLSSDYFLTKIKRITTKGTMSTAYLKDIDKISLFVHPIQQQTIIGESLGLIDNAIEMNMNKYDKIKKQRKVLQQYLLNGIVRVEV